MSLFAACLALLWWSGSTKGRRVTIMSLFQIISFVSSYHIWTGYDQHTFCKHMMNTRDYVARILSNCNMLTS
ncbi:hypothetical protein EDD22DRAFT_887419 [Suillus occidentalis]|nr:hypothetical protein EDD22DRAFT_887419 [Suillus occidentalis]